MNVLSRKGAKMRPRKWTKPAIQQAFDGFIKQHNRLPTNYEMYEKYNGKFPRPLSVKLTLGATLEEYLRENYTTYYKRKQARIYGAKSDEYWIEDFKIQYIKFDKPSEKAYNKFREPNTPNTKTIAKIIGVTKWNEVLEYCGLVKEKKKMCGELIFEETLENYQKLNNKLQDLIKKFE